MMRQQDGGDRSSAFVRRTLVCSMHQISAVHTIHTTSYHSACVTSEP